MGTIRVLERAAFHIDWPKIISSVDLQCGFIFYLTELNIVKAVFCHKFLPFFFVLVIYYLITQRNVRIFAGMVLNLEKSDVLVDWFWSKLMWLSCGKEPELAANVSRI